MVALKLKVSLFCLDYDIAQPKFIIYKGFIQPKREDIQVEEHPSTNVIRLETDLTFFLKMKLTTKQTNLRLPLNEGYVVSKLVFIQIRH